MPVIDDDARIDISFRWIQEDQKGSRLTIPIRNLTYSQIKSGQVLEYVDDSLTLQVKGSVGLKGVTLTFLNTTEMFIDALHDGWIRGETTISSSYTGVELHVDNTFDVFVPNECFKAPPASSLTVAYIDMKAKRTPVLSFWINHIWQQAIIVYKNMPQTTVYQSFKLADGTVTQNTLIINTPVWLYGDNYKVTYELKTTAPRGRLNGNPYGKPGLEGTDVTYTTEMVDFSGRLGKSVEIEWEITPILQNRQHAFEILFVDDEKTLGTGSIEFYNILAHKSFILSENAPDNTYNVGTFKVHTQ